jgi:hypothetical protein
MERVGQQPLDIAVSVAMAVPIFIVRETPGGIFASQPAALYSASTSGNDGVEVIQVSASA